MHNSMRLEISKKVMCYQVYDCHQMEPRYFCVMWMQIWPVWYRKSTICYVFLLGNGIVAWSSHKQTLSSTMSSTEAEYEVTSFSSKELLWLRQLFKHMYEDIKSDGYGAYINRIDVCHHQLHDLQEKMIKV